MLAGFDISRPVRILGVRRIEDDYIDNPSAPATLERPGAGPGGVNSMASENPSQPYGYCQCGCGRKTNPDHLEAVTPAENIRRRDARRVR